MPVTAKKTSDTKQKKSEKKKPTDKTKVTKKSESAESTTRPKLERKVSSQWTAAERRDILFATLTKLRATNQTGAVDTTAICEASGLTAFDVYQMCYHKYPLVTSGVIKIVKHEGSRVLKYYLARQPKSGAKQPTAEATTKPSRTRRAKVETDTVETPSE